jgi:hypothetical protein
MADGAAIYKQGAALVHGGIGAGEQGIVRHTSQCAVPSLVHSHGSTGTVSIRQGLTHITSIRTRRH